MRFKQIIPCNVEMYAVYEGEEGKTLRAPVVLYGLDEEDGLVYPLVFDACEGVINPAEASNFLEYELVSRRRNKR